MKEVKTKGLFPKKFVLYDSVKELPVKRAHEFDKLVLQDFEIGDSIQDVFKHLSNFKDLLTVETLPQAVQELKNLHQNYYFLIHGISVKSYCFAAMVHEINGKKIGDMTEDNVDFVLSQITESRLKENDVIEVVSDIKKNLIRNLDHTFLTDILIPE